MKNTLITLVATLVFLSDGLAKSQIEIRIDVPDEIRFGEEFVVKYTINQQADLLEFKEPSENFSVAKKPVKSSSALPLRLQLNHALRLSKIYLRNSRN